MSVLKDSETNQQPTYLELAEKLYSTLMSYSYNDESEDLEELRELLKMEKERPLTGFVNIPVTPNMLEAYLTVTYRDPERTLPSIGDYICWKPQQDCKEVWSGNCVVAVHGYDYYLMYGPEAEKVISIADSDFYDKRACVDVDDGSFVFYVQPTVKG